MNLITRTDGIPSTFIETAITRMGQTDMASSTAANYTRYLRRYAQDHDTISYDNIRQWLTQASQELAPRTTHLMLAAIKWMARELLLHIRTNIPITQENQFLWQTVNSQLTAIQAMTVKLPKPNSQQLTGRYITTEEMFFLQQIAQQKTRDHNLAGIRDQTLFIVAYTTGLRISELLNIQESHIDFHNKNLHVPKFKGSRGQRGRTIPLHDTAVSIMQAWLTHIKVYYILTPLPHIMGAKVKTSFPTIPDQIYLFPSIRRGGHLTTKPLTKGGAWKVLKGYEAQLSKIVGHPVRLTSHDYRRSMVSNMSREGDIAQAQRMAGHADAGTTINYIRHQDDEIRQTLNGISIPLISVGG